MFAMESCCAHYLSMPEREEFIPTRASLLQRLKNWEDQASWEDFFNAYWKIIYGLARHTGLSDAEAQDVVQETMATVARQMPGFNYNPALGSFKTWLMNQTRWRIVDQFRKRGPLPSAAGAAGDSSTAADPIAQLIDPASENANTYWENEWQRNLYDAAVANVRRKADPGKYQIFDFLMKKEWPAEKVASFFKISVDQVYVDKHRISEMIKAEVKRLEKGAS